MSILPQGRTLALRTHAASASDLSSSPPGSAEAARKMQAVQLLVDKAEQDIRLKTEAVLNTTLNDQYTTLPAIRDGKR